MLKGKKVKVKPAVCYSAAYIRSAFTISEVTADWHELMILQRTMWPSTARTTGPVVCS